MEKKKDTSIIRCKIYSMEKKLGKPLKIELISEFSKVIGYKNIKWNKFYFWVGIVSV